MSIYAKVFFRDQHTCPWWLCFTLDNPLRRWLQKPDLIVKELVQQGQTALDIGCGTGYFSVALARAVGPTGKVICIDLQEKMLEMAARRAERAGVSKITQFHRCTENSLGLKVVADFALAFYMVHEVRNKREFLGEVRDLLRSGGTFLLVEPKHHVTEVAFNETVSLAEELGFKSVDKPARRWSRAVLLKKP
jgi:ubiquinone/menaquinone biosynthesis C-methylase UbiE